VFYKYIIRDQITISLCCLWIVESKTNTFKLSIYSFTLRHNFWSRDHDHPADDFGDGQVPRHPEQRPRVHEVARGPEGLVGKGDGLRRLNMVDDERN